MDALDDSASRALADALDDVLAKVAVAVRDWKPMKARLDAAITALEQQTKTRENAGLIDETIAFCRWMRAGQFVFLGMREYRLDGEPETGSLRVIEGSGLGLLADERNQRHVTFAIPEQIVDIAGEHHAACLPRIQDASKACEEFVSVTHPNRP